MRGKRLPRLFVLLFTLLLSLPVPVNGLAADSRLSNQLADHPSPYLALHGHDPVHWQVWSAETLAVARQLNRPLFVSSGYFSCHWCHVMQRESYQDEKIARLLNEAFVPVKVDRELNPALDAHLIEFVELTRGQAGWPLNVILTPDGYPILGMTYLPRERFQNLLEQVRQRWRDDESGLRKLASDAMTQWQGLRTRATATDAAAADPVRAFLTQVDGSKDELAGGFGEQSKFPMVSQLQALVDLMAAGKAGNEQAFVRLTLEQMATQGMHDNLGGGFFRYVTDPDWQTPHFEKMLYDNARLASLYLQAARVFHEPNFRDIGLATVDFMLNNLRRPDGGFFGSFSAVDSQGREGFYYLWDPRELKTLLSADEYRAVGAAWFDEQAVALDHGYLPLWRGSPEALAGQLGWSQARFEKVLAAAKQKMLAVRHERELLPDTKVLTAWNGLVLSAIAAAYQSTEDKRYARAGDRLAQFLATRLWTGKQLRRSLDKGKSLGKVSLADYALAAQGLWDWSRARPETRYGKLAASLVSLAWQRYYRNGRWLTADAPLIPMLEGKLALEDSSLPSATAVLCRLSRDIPAVRHDATLQTELDGYLKQVRAGLGDNLFWYAGYLPCLTGQVVNPLPP